MDDTTNQQPISDDQELAKVLAGVSEQAEDAVDSGAGQLAVPTMPAVSAPPVAMPEPIAPPAPVVPEPSVPVVVPASDLSNDDLDSIKLEALQELRPLVGKLNVPADEKFDTYLLLLRSTDDKALIAPAHEAAKSIEDETRRAQALLDIIKEIDFLSQGTK